MFCHHEQWGQAMEAMEIEAMVEAMGSQEAMGSRQWGQSKAMGSGLSKAMGSGLAFIHFPSTNTHKSRNPR